MNLMTQHEIMLLMSYIYNIRVQCEQEVRELQSNIRFRKIYVADCTELTCAIQRLETVTEVTEHILLLLKLSK